MNGPEPRNDRSSPPPGPFGFLMPTMDTPYEPAPAPPPGPALLDDNESNMLDNFFTTLNSNQFSNNDLWMQSQQNKPFGATNFGWSDELPPTFEGSTTSLQPPGPQASLEKPGAPMFPNGHGVNQDLFAAASMLYHTGSNPPEIQPTVGQNPFAGFPNLDFGGVRSNGHAKDRSHTTHVSPRPTSAAAPARPPVAYHTSEMLFDVREPISPEQQATAKVRPLHWGSDVSFLDQGYVRPADQPDEEERVDDLLSNLQCFERQNSAANTRAPSPERATGPHMSWPESGTANRLGDGRREYGESMDGLLQPSKRQKTLIKEEDEGDSDGDLSQPRRKSKASTYNKPRRMSSNAVRRSSIQSNAKSARENLTEEQKRSNHILSEQKRRNLIRQGFDDLCSLVPGLRGGGFSKSAMLTQAADWLEEVLRGNEILKSQLAELKTVNGLMMPR
ncbi:basic helix-loop-helix domain-containing protein [Aspergillus candidus]|uniref:BHLH domain-containing protein n=1 Tax=Aspergillus candidus TaxID=41067 RepID=A0A2I2FFU3_ASPCN|nr:hypothetical protein BDW47DRAFT_103157 [Aspergillus candidus]PLB39508.1 hypothetical protein BDW47DRAFT_103157 [Aspergillus candidus]